MSLKQKCFTVQAVIFVCLFVLSTFPRTAQADDLLNLGREFLSRLSPVYQEAEAKPFDPIDQIPDGGTMLLKPRAEKYFIGDVIYAIKERNTIFLELTDFINILDFPIDYDSTTQSGTGWFLREDWTIQLDLAARTVESQGRKFNISDDDLIEQDGLVFVKYETLAEWFNLQMDFNIEQQIVDIKSPFPFPAVARLHRENNFRGRNQRVRNVAILPRFVQPKSMFDVNTADVSIGSRYFKNRYGDATTQQTASVLAQGEFLKHNGFIFASGDDENRLRNVRAQLFNRSEDADLLGPLRARSYAFGDIEEIRVPLISESERNVGFRISNSTLENTDFATTNIEGRAFPGWDVQLYRDGVLIDVQTVGSDGQYIFDAIQLFAGENDFELFFFGPQGEIRAQRFSSPVSAALLANQDNTYEISVALEDTQTYRDNYTANEDANNINFTAKYNKMIGNNNLAYLGMRTRALEGERKVFLSAGTTSTFGATLIDTNFAIDEKSETSAQAIVRRNLLGWNTSLRARINSDNFRFQNAANTIIREVALNAQRAVSFGAFKSSLLVDALYTEFKEGTKINNVSFAVANKILGASISNRLRYEKSESKEGIDTDKLQHAFSLRKNFGNVFLSLGSTYTIEPDSQIENARAQINYRYSNDFSMDATFDRQFRTDIDYYRLNANYTHDKFRLSPFVQYSSDNEVTAGLNLNFSLYDAPNSPYPNFTNRNLSGRGAMSAFVYHDTNGNNIFDGDDVPLPDAAVESLTSQRRVLTDEHGYATISDLPVTRATDIALKADALPDPFMLPATPGNSIYPVEGTIHRLEFPVHMTGEIDGTVFYYGEDVTNKIPVGYHDLKLISLDNSERQPIDIRAERDGYYIAFMIPPGEYLLISEKKGKYGNTVPQNISIGYDGPILQDINVELIPDAAYVPYEITHASNKTAAQQHQQMLKVKKSGQSDLSKTLTSLLTGQKKEFFEDLVQVASDKDADAQYDYFIPLSTNDLQNSTFLHEKCRILQQAMIECTVNITVAAKN